MQLHRCEFTRLLFWWHRVCSDAILGPNGPISPARNGARTQVLGFAYSYSSLHIYTRVYLALSLGGRHGLYDFIIIIVAPRVNVQLRLTVFETATSQAHSLRLCTPAQIQNYDILSTSRYAFVGSKRSACPDQSQLCIQAVRSRFNYATSLQTTT